MPTGEVTTDPLGDLVKNLFYIYQKTVELKWDGAKFGFKIPKMASL